MHLLLIAAVSLVMFASIVTLHGHGEMDRPRATADASIQVEQYRMFMFVADQFMKTQSPAGAGTITVDWTTMANSSVAPPSTKLMAMPAGWRVVRAADLSWVTCTEMDERSIGALNQLLSAGVIADGSSGFTAGDLQNASVQLSNASAQTTSFVVLGSPGTAAALASLCNI